MTAITIGGVRCEPQSPAELAGGSPTNDPTTWVYEVVVPRPDGVGATALWDLGDECVLQTGARLGLNPAEEEALRIAIASDGGVRTAVNVTPRQLAVREVSLELTRADGSVTVLATSQSSGYPPYAAIFNVRLDRVQSVEVRRAIAARSSQLRITYRVEPAARSHGPTVTSWHSTTLRSSDRMSDTRASLSASERTEIKSATPMIPGDERPDFRSADISAWFDPPTA